MGLTSPPTGMTSCRSPSSQVHPLWKRDGSGMEAGWKRGGGRCGHRCTGSEAREIRVNISWMRRAGIAFAAAAVGVVISVGSASAADGGLFTANGSGHAKWTENGDTLEVCDDYPDNKGVRAYIYRPNAGDPANGTVLIKGDDPKTSDGCCVYGLDEHRRVHRHLHQGVQLRRARASPCTSACADRRPVGRAMLRRRGHRPGGDRDGGGRIPDDPLLLLNFRPPPRTKRPSAEGVP